MIASVQTIHIKPPVDLWEVLQSMKGQTHLTRTLLHVLIKAARPSDGADGADLHPEVLDVLRRWLVTCRAGTLIAATPPEAGRRLVIDVLKLIVTLRGGLGANCADTPEWMLAPAGDPIHLRVLLEAALLQYEPLAQPAARGCAVALDDGGRLPYFQAPGISKAMAYQLIADPTPPRATSLTTVTFADGSSIELLPPDGAGVTQPTIRMEPMHGVVTGRADEPMSKRAFHAACEIVSLWQLLELRCAPARCKQDLRKVFANALFALLPVGSDAERVFDVRAFPAVNLMLFPPVDGNEHSAVHMPSLVPAA